eukprot:9802065-Lingulodinium_polyedra.AAC.1
MAPKWPGGKGRGVRFRLVLAKPRPKAKAPHFRGRHGIGEPLQEGQSAPEMSGTRVHLRRVCSPPFRLQTLCGWQKPKRSSRPQPLRRQPPGTPPGRCAGP